MMKPLRQKTTTGVTLKRSCQLLGALALPMSLMQPASAIDLGHGWSVHGWARQSLSMNLKDHPETTDRNDKWDLSMNRQSLYLDAQGPTGPLHWVVRTRFTHESLTNYEKELQSMTKAAGSAADFRKEYNEHDLREAFFDWAPNDRVNFRVGRQQVVWGETDFFHATDVIHGFDLRWRKFLNSSSEEWRKPLFLINTEIAFPSVDGSLQLLLRPGWDPDDAIGNSDPTFGGRWSNYQAKGTNLASVKQGGFVQNNFHYKHNGIRADSRDPHYGLRWTGDSIGDKALSYSLSYYHGVGGGFQDPILIVDLDHPRHGNPAQFILPETDTYGASLSGFAPGINAVYRAEVAYTPHRPMADFAGNVIKEDIYNYVLGLDFSPRMQNMLGTSNSSMLSFQVFDWNIPSIDKKDQIVRFDGSGYYHKHNIIGTMVFSNPYMNDNLNATLVYLKDFTDGGGMIIPSLEYQYRKNWRFKVEYDRAYGGDTTKAYGGFPTDPAGIFGALKNDDQLLFEVTYQF